MLPIRTAKEWGLAPSAIIAGRKKGQRKFKAVDYALAMAVQMLDDEKCPKCGVPIWHAYSTDNTIEFEMDHIDCHSCAFKEVEEKKIKKDTPGRTNIVKPVPIEGMELPDRSDFYERVIAEAKAKQK